MALCQWYLGWTSCLISFVWDQSTCQERIGSEKYKMKKKPCLLWDLKPELWNLQSIKTHNSFHKYRMKWKFISDPICIWYKRKTATDINIGSFTLSIQLASRCQFAHNKDTILMCLWYRIALWYKLVSEDTVHRKWKKSYTYEYSERKLAFTWVHYPGHNLSSMIKAAWPKICKKSVFVI